MTNSKPADFPVLTTDRLTLRQLSKDDQQNIFALRSNAEVNKYLDRQPCNTMADAMSFINTVNENIEKNNSAYWAITLSGPNTFVGTICLFDFSEENSSCEMGYELMPEFQGKGIMTEAAEKVIEYVFKTLRFQKIAAYTHNNNEHSIKLLLKLNFIKDPGAANENPDFSLFTLSKAH